MHVSDSNDHIISHNPATYQAPVTSSVEKPKKPILILATVGLLLVILGGIWYFNGKSFDFIKEETGEFAVDEIDDTVLATVGSEQIFARDLNYKKSLVPAPSLTPELEASLLDRLIDESIILQAGADAGYVELSAQVFNTPLKDQQTRQKLITEITEKINNEASYKKGAFVSIWFMNYQPGPIGYEAGKEVALEKITQLHQAVSNGTMTIKQAGDAIKSDASLAQLDPSYASNAYSEFDTSVSPYVTADQAASDAITALDQSEVSDVLIIQDYENSDLSQPKKDAVYVFGQVTEVKAGETPPFDDWLIAQKENYAVVKN